FLAALQSLAGEVETHRGEQLAVWAEGETTNGLAGGDVLWVLIRGQVPQLRRLANADCRQALTVGGEDQRFDRRVVAAERANMLAGGGVPQLHRSIPARRRQPPAVGTVGDSADPVIVSLQFFLDPAGRGVPQACRSVPGAGRDLAAIRTNRDAGQAVAMPFQ